MIMKANLSLLLLVVLLCACSRSSPTEPESALSSKLSTRLGEMNLTGQCTPDVSALHGGIDAPAHSGPVTSQSCIEIAAQQCNVPTSTFSGVLQGFTIVVAQGASWISGNEMRIECGQQQAGVRHESCHALRRYYPCISDPDGW
jgi:hypothetical protein